MNLLDAFKQYIRDAMPGGALNPEWTPERVEAADAVASATVPGYGLLEIGRDLQDGNYGSAALEAGLLAMPPMIAAPLRHNGLLLAEKALKSVSKGEKPKAEVIADLTEKQFKDLNALRRQNGYPPFKSPEVLYNGTHHFNSRQNKDGATIEEMLAQIEGSLADTAIAKPHPRAPYLEGQTQRIDQWGSSVKDRAVLEGGGDRPTWLLSAFGREQKKKNP